MIDQEPLDRLVDPEKGSELQELEIAKKINKNSVESRCNDAQECY